MNVIGLNGRSYKITFIRQQNNRFAENKSSLHLFARQLLLEVYPGYCFYEEIYLPGCKNKLYLDFLSPQLRLGCEIQGEQHTRHIHHFHATKKDFLLAQSRDRLKKEWATTNQIDLIELRYDDQDNWANLLRNYSDNG
ncbi:MAG: hypothetical protein ACHQ1D_00375 [Nitrososphaerales archaeon]